MFRQSQRLDGAHSGGIWSICWRDDIIVSGCIDGSCKLWTAKKNDDNSLHIKLKTTSSPRNFGITSVLTSNNSDFGVSCSQDSMIRFFNLEDLSDYDVIDAGILEAWTVCLSDGDDMLATGTHSGALNIWSVAEKTKVCSIETKGKLILSSAFSQEGTSIATTGMDGVLNIIDIINQSIVHRIEAHFMPARKVVFSSDANLIFTASDDRHVSVYDVRSGSVINSFSHSGMALSLDLSPDRKHFIVGASDHTVSYWDLGMQRCLQKFDSAHSDFIWSVCFDDSGKKMASAGDDGVIQIYEFN